MSINEITIGTTDNGMFVWGNGKGVYIPNTQANREPARTIPETLEYLADVLAHDPASSDLSTTIVVRHASGY